MKRRMLDLLRCPVCHGELCLHVLSEVEQAVADLPRPEPACSRYCALHQIGVGEVIEAQTSPDCRGCYGREIREGLLQCARCRVPYPVIEGVPRLIRNACQEYQEWFYGNRERIGELDGQRELANRLGELDPAVFDRRSNESFSLQWQMYQYEDKTWFKDDVTLRIKEFLYNMNLGEEQLKGAVILDAGCGNGRLTASVARYGAEVVGMDLSSSVVRASENCARFAGEQAAFVHFVQGNIMEPPLAPQAFDHIHSSGVLHHTPDTRRAFRSFLRLVRPSGKAYVQLYRTREAWVGIPNRIIRAVTSRLPVNLLYRICHLLVPLHTAAVVVVARIRGEQSPISKATRRERAISMFDNYSPRYQYRYTPEQVRMMFKEEGLREVKDVTLDNEARHMVAFVGNK